MLWMLVQVMQVLRKIPKYFDKLLMLIALHAGIQLLLHWIILLKAKQNGRNHPDISQSNTRMDGI